MASVDTKDIVYIMVAFVLVVVLIFSFVIICYSCVYRRKQRPRPPHPVPAIGLCPPPVNDPAPPPDTLRGEVTSVFVLNPNVNSLTRPTQEHPKKPIRYIVEENHQDVRKPPIQRTTVPQMAPQLHRRDTVDRQMVGEVGLETRANLSYPAPAPAALWPPPKMHTGVPPSASQPPVDPYYSPGIPRRDPGLPIGHIDRGSGFYSAEYTRMEQSVPPLNKQIVDRKYSVAPTPSVPKAPEVFTINGMMPEGVLTLGDTGQGRDEGYDSSFQGSGSETGFGQRPRSFLSDIPSLDDQSLSSYGGVFSASEIGEVAARHELPPPGPPPPPPTYYAPPLPPVTSPPPPPAPNIHGDENVSRLFVAAH